MGRVARSHGRVRPDMGPECPERFDLSFLVYIAQFPGQGRGRIEAALKHFGGRRVTLRSRADINGFLATVPFGN
jgi:hypothetical protein